MTRESMEKIARVRALNDSLRRTLSGGRIMITQGVEALGSDAVARLLAHLRAFDQFDEGNDPYGEHDFGAIEYDGKKFFWKIDCYDLSLECASEDPADPQKTIRVLTLMLEAEY